MRLLAPLTSVADYADDAGHSEILASESTIVVTTPHPARLKGMKWKSGGLPRFLEQALDRAREEFAALVGNRSGSAG